MDSVCKSMKTHEKLGPCVQFENLQSNRIFIQKKKKKNGPEIVKAFDVWGHVLNEHL